MSRSTFFTDECLGKRVPAALRAAGADVRVHVDHFTQGTPDVDWLLRAIRGHRWVVLTKDKNMRRRPLEIAALMEAGLRVFAVTAGNLTGEKPGPFIARITRTGQVHIVRSRR